MEGQDKQTAPLCCPATALTENVKSWATIITTLTQVKVFSTFPLHSLLKQCCKKKRVRPEIEATFGGGGGWDRNRCCPTNPDDFVSGWASFEIQLSGYGQEEAAAGDFCLFSLGRHQQQQQGQLKERRVLGRYTLVRCFTVTRQQQRRKKKKEALTTTVKSFTQF